MTLTVEQVKKGFELDGGEAISYLEKLFATPELDRADPNILRLFNNFLVHCIRTRSYKKGGDFCDTIQDVASEYPVIFHNSACLYCLVGQFDQAIEQVRLARIHGGYQLIKALRDDDQLGPIAVTAGFLAQVGPLRTAIDGTVDERVAAAVQRRQVQTNISAPKALSGSEPGFELRDLKKLQKNLGSFASPSIVAFLSQWQGWEGVAEDLDLFSAAEILQTSDPEDPFAKKWLAMEPELAPRTIVIGAGQSRYLLLDREAPDNGGEWILLDYRVDTGIAEEFADLIAFLDPQASR